MTPSQRRDAAADRARFTGFRPDGTVLLVAHLVRGGEKGGWLVLQTENC